MIRHLKKKKAQKNEMGNEQRQTAIFAVCPFLYVDQSEGSRIRTPLVLPSFYIIHRLKTLIEQGKTRI